MKPMAFSAPIVLVLFCGAFSAALDFKWNSHPASGRFGPPHPAPLQQKQSSGELLSWTYPAPPVEDEPRFPPTFEQNVPSSADSISAVCGENSIWVEANKDLLGIGKPVVAAEVTLGGCPAIGEDPNADVLIFESKLHGCGSQLAMVDDSFIYTFTLLYTPSPLGGSDIIRTEDIAVDIQCHYQRKHDVSSWVLTPTLSPFSVSKTDEESLYFSIKLLTDDWRSTRPSAVYLMGDMMKFEVSVKQFYHVPLRVTVDSCVATVAANIDTVPRYVFLGNNGCLFDSQLTGSSSRFLPRSQNDKLQFQVEAFRFQQEDNGVIYITCNVRATSAALAIDSTNKACSFANGWREASGSHQACSCCDSDCDTQRQTHLTGKGKWVDSNSHCTCRVNLNLLHC
uniref:Zona pellucida sperm-binding protein 3 n=1 Tax=Cyclopterus lumpus TaxID=8103 RepID=A0A8C2YYJ5_CYCLU